jgi:glutathione S-transferase
LAVWVERCRAQVGGALDVIEAARAARPTPWLFGDAIGHADIILAAMARFIGEALPGVFAPADRPALAAHSVRAEALPVFREISQTFKLTPPGG